jgi:hypothetical protein
MILYGLVALFLRAGIDWVGVVIAKRLQRIQEDEWEHRRHAMSTEPPTPGGTPPFTEPPTRAL